MRSGLLVRLLLASTILTLPMTAHAQGSGGERHDHGFIGEACSPGSRSGRSTRPPEMPLKR